MAAIRAASLLKSPENLTALCRFLESTTSEKQSIMRCLLDFPDFDAKPTLQAWFRNAEVVDEIGICEKYVCGSISAIDPTSLSMNARLIWQFAEWYGVHERQEVIEFLVGHLDFDQSWFSSQKFSTPIVCRGRVATTIIAKLNGWWPTQHEATKESVARMNLFISSLWNALRADPSVAFQFDCPVRYIYPPTHKIHKQIDQLLGSHGQILEDDREFGYSLRQSNEGDDLILALHEPRWHCWRIVRLSESEQQLLGTGEVSAKQLFFRYSSRGALVAFRDQILTNANDLENKFAQAAIRKLLKAEARKTAKKATLIDKIAGEIDGGCAG